VLLPHGYEGMGPEHSSARLERFLQLSDDDPDIYPEMDILKRTQIQETNWQELNCTTPANYFHALRRQIYRNFRKPLIIMSPKYLLRHKLATSSLKDMATGSGFHRLIPETENEKMVPDDQVRKVVFCSGKIYYTLFEARETRYSQKPYDIALVRIEQ